MTSRLTFLSQWAAWSCLPYFSRLLPAALIFTTNLWDLGLDQGLKDLIVNVLDNERPSKDL